MYILICSTLKYLSAPLATCRCPQPSTYRHPECSNGHGASTTCHAGYCAVLGLSVLPFFRSKHTHIGSSKTMVVVIPRWTSPWSAISAFIAVTISLVVYVDWSSTIEYVLTMPNDASTCWKANASLTPLVISIVVSALSTVSALLAVPCYV